MQQLIDINLNSTLGIQIIFSRPFIWPNGSTVLKERFPWLIIESFQITPKCKWIAELERRFYNSEQNNGFCGENYSITKMQLNYTSENLLSHITATNTLLIHNLLYTSLDEPFLSQRQ